MLALAISLAGFVVGVVGVYLQVQFANEQKSFHAAATCSSPSEAAVSQRCAYMGPATVTGTHRDVRIFVDLRFDALPGRTFATSFATTREPPPAAIRVGASQPAQLWDGKVTTVAGVGTADDPDYLQTNSIPAAAIFAVVSLVAAIGSTVLVRRAWRR